MAAHQVMIQIYMACTVWGEPLCQTAQSFMPELMYGVNKSLAKARFSVALLRLVSPNGILYSGEASINQKLRTA
ncbi:Protein DETOXIFICATION 46, chloroplastic [Trifolium repens]|nr:Protein DETOXIFICATION 46, chloroplastic [Trifolium repens]